MFGKEKEVIGIGFHNGIGNMVIFTSILRMIASRYDVDIILDEKWNGRGPIEDIARALPFVSRVVLYPSEFSPKRYKKFYMSLHNVFSDRFFLSLNKNIDPSKAPCWMEDFLHERDFYLGEVSEQLKVNGPIHVQFMPIANGFRHGWLERRNDYMDDDIEWYICIANGYQRTGQGELIRKMYPHWAEVVRSISDMYSEKNIRFFILGGEDDVEWAESLENELDLFHTTSLAGKLTILESARLISQSDFVLCNDSSMMHVADALEVPGVTVFGSTLVSKNGPLNGNIEVIRSPLKCAPCQGTTTYGLCGQIESCMDAIPPEWVVAAFRKISKRNKR